MRRKRTAFNEYYHAEGGVYLHRSRDGVPHSLVEVAVLRLGKEYLAGAHEDTVFARINLLADTVFARVNLLADTVFARVNLLKSAGQG